MDYLEVSLLKQIKNNEPVYFSASTPVKYLDGIWIDVFKRYGESPPQMRGGNPGLLYMVSAFSETIPNNVNSQIGQLFSYVYGPAAQVISLDDETYIRLREAIVDLAYSWIQNCSQGLLKLNPESDFVLFFQSLSFLVKNPIPSVSIKAIKTYTSFFSLIEKTTPQFRNAFLNQFFLEGLETAFIVLTDTYHKYAFVEEVGLIKRIITLTCEGNNPQFIGETLARLLANESDRPLEFFVEFANFLLTKSGFPDEFKQGIRDFLIMIKQYSSADPDLYKEEASIIQEQANLIKHEEDKAIQGLILDESDFL